MLCLCVADHPIVTSLPVRPQPGTCTSAGGVPSASASLARTYLARSKACLATVILRQGMYRNAMRILIEPYCLEMLPHQRLLEYPVEDSRILFHQIPGQPCVGNACRKQCSMATQADAEPRRQASFDTASYTKQAGKMKVATNKAAIRLHDR